MTRIWTWPCCGSPALKVGDSDDVRTGDPIRILGYPGVGGTSITVTDGIVSGRFPAATKGGPWIKTDAAIAGGNSGGTALDTEGRLIGVPTQVAGLRCENEEDSAVSCDGYSLGFIRPINEAAALIEKAKNATSPVPVSDFVAEQEPNPTEPGTEGGSITNARFGGRDAADAFIAPVDGVLDSAQSPNACLWFDTVDVAKGTTYDVTGVVGGGKATGTLTDSAGGSHTESWCLTSTDGGNPPTGTYTFTVTITGRADSELEVTGTYS
jgi:hypothetical protein